MIDFSRIILLAIGGIGVVTGGFIFLLPQQFYQAVPGMEAMGPFNMHFIRDVGLVYFTSGGTLIASSLLSDHRLALAGGAWLFLHALFHLQIWGHRGFPFDSIFWFDLFAVIVPSLLALWGALRMSKNRAMS